MLTRNKLSRFKVDDNNLMLLADLTPLFLLYFLVAIGCSDVT